jgi:hypothetical protein
MKKSTVKLVLRRETLRALAQIELSRVAGGDAALVGTGGPETGCPFVQAAQAKP